MKPETAIDKIAQEIIEIGSLPELINGEESILISVDNLRMYLGMASAVALVEGLSVNTRKRPVFQYDKEGKYVDDFTSIKSASKMTGICMTSIQKTLSKKHPQKTAGGYIWKYNTLE